MTEMTLVIGDKNSSSWSLRPWLALKVAGIHFQEILVPLHNKRTKLDIVKYSPSGKVPVLLHEEIRIWESLAICEYIAELFPAANLWPREPEARAVARSVAAEMHAGFMQLRQNLPMDIAHHKRVDVTAISDDTNVDIQRITQIWKTCRERYGKDGPFLFSSFTIADAMYAPVAVRFKIYEIEIMLVKELQSYMQTLLDLPELRSWMDDAAG